MFREGCRARGTPRLQKSVLTADLRAAHLNAERSADGATVPSRGRNLPADVMSKSLSPRPPLHVSSPKRWQSGGSLHP